MSITAIATLKIDVSEQVSTKIMNYLLDLDRRYDEVRLWETHGLKRVKFMKKGGSRVEGLFKIDPNKVTKSYPASLRDNEERDVSPAFFDLLAMSSCPEGRYVPTLKTEINPRSFLRLQEILIAQRNENNRMSLSRILKSFTTQSYSDPFDVSRWLQIRSFEYLPDRVPVLLGVNLMHKPNRDDLIKAFYALWANPDLL